MDPIYFVVYGKPQGKARPRLTRSGQAYTPKSTKTYELMIRRAFRKETARRYEPGVAFPAGVPVRLTVRVFHEMPKSASRVRKARMMDGRDPCIRRPDLDNVLKVVADALNGWAYSDDAQITRWHADRAWSVDPRIEITLEDASV